MSSFIEQNSCSIKVTNNLNDTAHNDRAMIISDLRSFVSSEFKEVEFNSMRMKSQTGGGCHNVR